MKKIKVRPLRSSVPRFEAGMLPHTLFFLMILGWSVTWMDTLRAWGAYGMGVLGLGVAAYVVATNALYRHAALLVFTVVGGVYIILSYARVLPDAWTQYYDPSYILDQAYYVFFLYPLVCASQTFWRHALVTRRLDIYMGLMAVVTSLYMVWYNLAFTLDKPVVMPGMLNYTLLFLLAWGYFILVRGRRMALLLAAPLVTYMILGQVNVQTVIVALSLLALILLPVATYRWFLLAMMGALIMGFTGGLLFIDDYSRIDPNVAYRYLAWQAAIEAFFDTWGLGVGFGKEMVSNAIPKLGIYALFEQPHDILENNLHNSFLAMFYTLGMAGGLSFLLFYVRDCFPREGQHKPLYALSVFIFFCAFLSTYINVGIESPLAMVGIAFALGFVLSVKTVYSKGGDHHVATGTKL